MPIYQVKCQSCGAEDEIITGCDNRETACRICHAGRTTRIPSVRGANIASESAGWIRSVLEVVDKDCNRPWCVEFLKNPTRSNYKAWMRGEGIRPIEEGEKPFKGEEINPRFHAEKIMQLKQQRERIRL